MMIVIARKHLLSQSPPRNIWNAGVRKKLPFIGEAVEL
jgi:hypothetical protein